MNSTFWSCGSCGDQFLPHQGKISQDSEYHASFMCDECLKMPRYTITINFRTDRELTQNELDDLQGHLLLQIEEPVNEDQEDETYETSQINHKIERVK